MSPCFVRDVAFIASGPRMPARMPPLWLLLLIFEHQLAGELLVQIQRRLLCLVLLM